MKERMIALSPRYNNYSRTIGLELAGNVHDEVLSELPKEASLDPAVHKYVIDLLQTPSIPFNVPIITGLGVSDTSWAEAAGDETRENKSGLFLGGKIV